MAFTTNKYCVFLVQVKTTTWRIVCELCHYELIIPLHVGCVSSISPPPHNHENYIAEGEASENCLDFDAQRRFKILITEPSPNSEVGDREEGPAPLKEGAPPCIPKLLNLWPTLFFVSCFRAKGLKIRCQEHLFGSTKTKLLCFGSVHARLRNLRFQKNAFFGWLTHLLVPLPSFLFCSAWQNLFSVCPDTEDTRIATLCSPQSAFKPFHIEHSGAVV